jgi:hypothetical protein
VQCGRGSKILGSVRVALWGNGNAASVLKCHETGAILCVYGLVGNLQTRETREFHGILANGKAPPGLPTSENLFGTLRV